MNCQSYYLGEIMTDIVEGLKKLDEEMETDKITLEQYEHRKDLLSDDISDEDTDPEWLVDEVFRSLEEIAGGEYECITLESSGLYYHDISPETLSDYLSQYDCRGFRLLADTAETARYVLELQQLGWTAEPVYKNDMFKCVHFEN